MARMQAFKAKCTSVILKKICPKKTLASEARPRNTFYEDRSLSHLTDWLGRFGQFGYGSSG
jgi:hypothetical protein